MIRDTDPWAVIRELERRISRLEAGSNLEHSAIDHGQMRFVTSTLRMESGSTLILSGTLDGEGTLTWTGAWTLAGEGQITGPVTVSGADGKIVVDGAVPITLRQVSGAARIEFGGPGAYVMGQSGGIVVRAGDAVMLVSGEAAAFTNGPMSMGVSDTDAFLVGLQPPPPGANIRYVAVDDTTGALYKVSGGSGGGPGDGVFEWPFPLDQVTSEFRSAERPNHDGIDFGIGPSNTIGTPIPSMGAGVVHRILSVNDGTHGWGNGVIIDHGADPLYGGANIKTLYAHMNTAPVVGLGASVTLGQTLGPIGNTGNSFGAHLHLEVWVDDVPVNPRTFMAAHGG